MRSFSEIITECGGPSAFAIILGTTQQNVSQMRQRNFIPPRFWPATVKAAKEKGIEGVTFENLATLAASRATASVAAE